MAQEKKYFNFPVQFLKGFLTDHASVLTNILHYAIYVRTLDYEYNEDEPKIQIESAANEFNVQLGSVEHTLISGEELHKNTPDRSPKVGINLSIFWDFYRNPKTEFEIVTLLGFLALKSILQNKTYCKMTNLFWLSRMDGRAKSVEDFTKLSKSIQKYANEYQTKKIKYELRDNWGLITYSRYTRGFYVSLKLSLEDLIYQAELNRKSTKLRQAKFAEQLALDRVLDKINSKLE